MITWGRALAISSLAATTIVAGCNTSSGPEQVTATKSTSTNTSGSSASQAPGTPKPVTGKPASVTVLASGDIMANPAMVTSAKAAASGSGYDFSPFLSPLAPIVSKSDISICQMESPLSPDNTDLTLMDVNRPSFNAPHEMAAAVKGVGFEGCSTANNHAYDRKLKGLVGTRQVMASTGLKASGPGADASTPGDPVFYEAHGLKVAQLSYSYTLDNLRSGAQEKAPVDAPWMARNLYSARTPQGIETDAAAARRAGADIVIVSMHWGVEYADVSPEQEKYAEALLRSGQVDWIVGNHPHVVQTCQKINGRYVNYALGNTMGSQDPDYWLRQRGKHVDDGILSAVTFTRDADGHISETMRYQPIHEPYSDHVTRPAAAGSDPFKRVSATMSGMGCDATPME